MMWGNRIQLFFLALLLWRNANGLGVWQNRPATYWQSGGGSKGPGDQALSPAQKDFSSTASGLQTPAYDVGAAQPLSSSGSGESAFIRPYTFPSDQDLLDQYRSFGQSKGGYTAQSSGFPVLSQSSTNQAAPAFQSQLVSSPAYSSQGSASQSLASQQSSLQLASPSQRVSSLPQGFTTSYALGTQTSRPVAASLSVASDVPTTSQQASYGSQSATGTVYGQPSSWFLSSQGQSAQTSYKSQNVPYKPVSPSQGSASQPLASQQRSLLLGSSSLGTSSVPQSLSVSFVPATQTQPRPVAASLSVASDVPTTSQQASYGSQSATGTVYGQPSSWFSSSQGQTTSQFGSSPYTPVSPSQGSFSQSLALQQSRLSLPPLSQGPSQHLGLSASYVPGTHTQPSRPVAASLSVASDVPTTYQQASYGSQSAAGTLYGQSSTLYTSSQSQSVKVPSQSADAPYKPVVDIVGAYTAGPAQWFRVGPFGQTGQATQPLVQSQGSGSQGSQAASSSYLTTSQTLSTPGFSGFGFQSQSAPASTQSLTKSSVLFPSYQTSSRFPTSSFSAASSSDSVFQPLQGAQSSVTWTSPGVSTAFGQSTSGQVAPVATSQQFSRVSSQSTGLSGSLPSQTASTSQTSGNYGSAFLSSTTQVGSFDQNSPGSSVPSRASTFAQGTPTNFGLLQGYGTQGLGADVQKRPATSGAQGGSSLFDSSSFERSGSTSYSFSQELDKPVFSRSTRRGQDQFDFSVKH